MLNAALMAGSAVQYSKFHLENHDACATLFFVVGAGLLAAGAYFLCRRPACETLRYLRRR